MRSSINNREKREIIRYMELMWDGGRPNEVPAILFTSGLVHSAWRIKGRMVITEWELTSKGYKLMKERMK